MIKTLPVSVLVWLFLWSAAAGEAMLQYFNTTWAEITEKMPELAEAGYESLWLPPPKKASGGLSVGYDVWDRFDLGSKDQRGTVSTRYGTEAELLELVKVAHRFGIRVYFDNIMNHNAFETPGFNEFVPEDVYPGFLPGDFHLRVQGDGTYRKWDNTRDWNDEWQVLNLGLSDLIDIAQEPGTQNLNHGGAEGHQLTKPYFLRHPNDPGYYCYIPTVPAVPGEKHSNGNGTYVGFGPGNGITEAFLLANEDFYKEQVEDLLTRAARWQLDRTKADGFRLDAVKHARADFFGATYGAGKDESDYGYLGGAQRQFNLTRGYSDANHRDSVFNIGQGRDDAMMFGEHLGSPPGTAGYIDAGMRLIDNDLRSELNNRLGNPWNGLNGYDNPGAGGFGPSVSVMHAQSHDSDFAAVRELQHAMYFTRDGLPLVYTDGNYHAPLLAASGGAFPRHAGTAFLGQWGDNRLPNLGYIHQHFARGYQVGRWSDADLVVYERIDKRENGGMSDADGAVAIVMLNDNLASWQNSGGGLSTAFPSVSGGSNAYLYQYARGYGNQIGFYKWASELATENVPPGSYYVFSWRTPEESNAWKDFGGRPIEILQSGQRVETMTVTRRDGPDGDGGFNGPAANPGFHPYPEDITNPVTDDFEYDLEIPRVTDASDLDFVVRTDGSAANILFKLDGGIDLNGTGGGPAKRDNPPAVTTDTFLGYEQPSFVERMGPEKFAATNTVRCTLGSWEAEYWEKTIGSGTVTRTNSPSGTNPSPGDTVFFVYHDATADLPADVAVGKHYQESGGGIDVYVKTNAGLDGYKGALYYTLDGTTPEGAGGRGGTDSTMVVPMGYVTDSLEGGEGSWWKGTIPPGASGSLRYIAAVRRTTVGLTPVAPRFPSGPSEVSDKKDMMTTFEINGFNGETVEFFPHNDYCKTPDQASFVMQTGLEEGFHIIRARSFLERDGKASLYNTFQQTFYYDANRPQGEVVFPAENDTVGGQSYGFVVRADSSTKEVWYSVDDGVGVNDDAATGASNGNGPGNWVRAAEVAPDPGIASVYPKEFRFDYINIPPAEVPVVPAVVHVRLVEATSSDPATWTGTVSPVDDTNGWYTTLSRNVVADGLNQELFVAFPANDGDVVDDAYTMKMYFSKSLDIGQSKPDFLSEFTVTVASQQSGSPDGAEVVDVALLDIVYNETVDYHALSFDVPDLYNSQPDFLHTVSVEHERGGIVLEASRKVKAAVVDLPFANIVTPPAVDGDGQPHVVVLPDVAMPTVGDRQVLIRVETDDDANQVDINFLVGSGTVTAGQVQTVGTKKFWDFTWDSVAEGHYRIQADVRKVVAGPVAYMSQLRLIDVVYGEVIPGEADDDLDGLPNWWELAVGLDPMDDGTVDPVNGASGDLDGDGLTNLEEFLVGLDPTVDDATLFPELDIVANGDGSMSLSFPSISDRLYKIFWSHDLMSWSQMGGAWDTTGQSGGVKTGVDTGLPDTPTHPSGELQRYYYLEIEMP